MDVDIPQEEPMETDPPIVPEHPQLTRKDSIIDPDGDEVMQGDETEYDEDIEIGDEHGDEVEEIEAEEEYVEHEHGLEGTGDVDEDVEFDEEVGDEGIGETQEESLETQDEDAGTIGTSATATGEDVTSASLPHASGTDSPAHPLPQATDTVAELENTIKDATDEVVVGTETGAADINGHAQSEVGQENKADKAVDDGDQGVNPAEGEHHDDANEHDEEEEEEGEGDEYDLLTPQTLPPIILNLPNSRKALFNPISDNDALPIWFADIIAELCEAPLTQVWAAIRAKVDEEGEGNGEDEMVICEKLMDLKMGDSDVNLEDVTFLELVQMYHDCELPHPLELHLEFHPHRFITRFNAIQKELEAREVIYIEDDEEEEEEGEGVVEEIQEGAHVHEDEKVAEGEGGAQESGGQTDTHQLHVPLPPLEPGQSAEGSQPKADDSTQADAKGGTEPGKPIVSRLDANARPKATAESKATPALPPTADEIALVKAGKPVDESLHLDPRKLDEEPLIESDTPATATATHSIPASAEGEKVVVPNTDPIGQPAGVPETIDPQDTPGDPPAIISEEAEVATSTEVPEDDRVGTDIDAVQGQAQAQPIAGEAAVYESAGDEDDDLIEGGEEYEEGDYDDEVDPDAVAEDEAGGEAEVHGEGEGLNGEVEVEGEGDGEGLIDDEEGGEAEGEGGDEDPYGVDEFINGLEGDAAGVDAESGGEVLEGEIEEEYEEYEDGADPEDGAEGEVYETEPEAAAEVEEDATVNPEENGGHAIDADAELGIQRDEEELVGDDEETKGDAEPANTEGGGTELAEGAGEVSPSLIKRGRSADLEEGGEEVVGKKVKIGDVE